MTVERLLIVAAKVFGLPENYSGVITSVSPDGRFYRLDGMAGGYRATRLTHA